MRIPIIRGVIDRRILVNYRVEPAVLARVLPEPFRPMVVNGFGMAGVCLIRLKHVRPRFVPGFIGISSENAAHRIAVKWEHNGERRQGVFIPRRDSSSRFNALVGGRVFPGVHHHATFDVKESEDHYHVALDSDDGRSHLLINAHPAADLPGTSLFNSLADASEFFKRGALGYSATDAPGEFDGLELRTFTWQVQPLAVEKVESSFFDDRDVFPSGSVEFDCALVMRGVEHEWIGRETLCA